MNLHAYAKDQGLTMKELGSRGGRKAGRIKSRKAELKKAYEQLKERNGDWWNK